MTYSRGSCAFGGFPVGKPSSAGRNGASCLDRCSCLPAQGLPPQPPAQHADGSGNQDKARFPRTKLNLGNRLVILDTLSAEECYHSTDRHTHLYETELEPHSFSKRKPPARESRGITCRLRHPWCGNIRHWASVDPLRSTPHHYPSLLPPPFGSMQPSGHFQPPRPFAITWGKEVTKSERQQPVAVFYFLEADCNCPTK